MQLLQRIEPIHALVIHHMAGLTQLQIDHSSAIATMSLRQTHDPVAQIAVSIRRPADNATSSHSSR